MAVPKSRTPKAKQQHRRSHHHVGLPQIVRDRASGGWQMTHTAGAERARNGRLVADQVDTTTNDV